MNGSELHPKSWTRKSTKGVQKSMGKELFSEELKLAVVQYVLDELHPKYWTDPRHSGDRAHLFSVNGWWEATQS